MRTGSLLRKLARNGIVLEGSGPRLAAAAAAVLAIGALTPMAAAANPRAKPIDIERAERIVRAQYVERRLPDLPSMGMIHDKSYPKVADFTRKDDPGMPAIGGQAFMLKSHSGKAISIDYEGIVANIRAQVEQEFPGKIYVVDRSKPAAEEASKIARLVGKPLGPEEMFVIGGDPHSSPAFGPRGPVCLVIGPQPELDVRDMTAGFVEDVLGTNEPMDFKAGPETTDEFWHALSIWHEVGHCLVGSSEAKADTFAVLKMMSEARRKDFTDFLIAVREVMERVSVPQDHHIISPTLRAVLERYGSTEFMSRPHTLRELAVTADGIETPIDAHMVLVRNLMAMTRYDDRRRGFDFKRDDYLVPVREGYVATDFYGWIKASGSVPEVGRINDLIAYLTGDPASRKVPKPFVADGDAAGKALKALADAGDPTARNLAQVFGAPQASSDTPLREGASLPASAEVPGRLIQFDRVSTVVRFSSDLRSFLVRDSVSKRPLMAGNTKDGITRVFNDARAKISHTAEGPSGSRF